MRSDIGLRCVCIILCESYFPPLAFYAYILPYVATNVMLFQYHGTLWNQCKEHECLLTAIVYNSATTRVNILWTIALTNLGHVHTFCEHLCVMQNMWIPRTYCPCLICLQQNFGLTGYIFCQRNPPKSVISATLQIWKCWQVAVKFI